MKKPYYVYSTECQLGCICLIVLLLSVAGTAQAVNLYVHPEGNDNWSGSLSRTNDDRSDGPLASLAGAQQAIRRVKVQGPLTEPVHVIISAGTYELTTPVVFTPADSGTKQCPILYEAAPGPRPVFTGGRRIRGFEQCGKGVWKTSVPQVMQGKWYFEQLFVNGRRATRARTPNKSYHYMGETSETVVEDSKDTYRRVTSVQPDVLEPLKNLSHDKMRDITLVAYHKWCITRLFLNRIDADANTVIIVGEKMKSYSPWPAKTRFYLENFRTALDEPGEWYLDRDGTLYYMPLPDEDMTNAEVKAPVAEKFVVFQGKPEAEQFVEHVHLRRLAFSHNQSLLPNTGYVPLQAAFAMDAAIMADGARNIRIADCQIGHVAAYGVWFRRGCRDCRIERCHIFDLGAGGVRIGEGTIRSDERSRTSHITADNNIIHSGGRVYTSAVGLWIGQSSDNAITHNDISDFFYTGISVGWTWGYGESLAQRNNISFNRVYNIGQGVLSDMGGIYTLGVSPGTVIRNNIFHDIESYSYGGWGLYTDEGSSDILMENNLVYNTKSGGFHQHYGKENIVRNNILAFSKTPQVTRTRMEPHISFAFEKNIVIFDNGNLLASNWSDDKFKMDNNCYWDIARNRFNFAGATFHDWRTRGHDQHSIIADPGFMDAKGRDFRLNPDSPAITKLSFEPFDYTKAGVYGQREWKNLAEQIRERLLKTTGKSIMLSHSEQWVRERMNQMLAVDDAYLWHNVLGGRAIHQNSNTSPPTVPLEGNFHTQQQASFASVKMSIYDLGERTETPHLDDARDLLNWVIMNGYDEEKRQFYFKYNKRSREWDKAFHAEFNMITVSALLRYDKYRSTPEFTAAAETVLARILETSAFKPESTKGLYGSGYLAIKLLDAYDVTGRERFLTSAREVNELVNQTLWDDKFGGWFIERKPGGPLPKHTTKFTHVMANMIQACFRLYLHGQGSDFRRYGIEALEFIAQHNRSPDGGWYRHNTRDGTDPSKPPGIGDGETTEPGTPCVYDRMSQMIVACCLAFRATKDQRYLRWIDETLDKMERTHLTRYPTGVNYGYIRANDYQNTWCHLWGLKAMIEIVKLHRDFGGTGGVSRN